MWERMILPVFITILIIVLSLLGISWLIQDLNKKNTDLINDYTVMLTKTKEDGTVIEQKASIQHSVHDYGDGVIEDYYIDSHHFHYDLEWHKLN